MRELPGQDINGWIAGRDPLTVVTLADSVIDELGYDVRGNYVETYWLPILGPSTIWAARRFADWLEVEPEGVVVDLGMLGSSLGLSTSVARHSPIVRTLARLADFGMAATGGNAFAVRRVFPPLPARYSNRLPGYLAERHQLELAGPR